MLRSRARRPARDGTSVDRDDADRAFTDAIAAGAVSVAPPEGMPWGERVAQVRDPDGNLLYLATPPTPS